MVKTGTIAVQQAMAALIGLLIMTSILLRKILPKIQLTLNYYSDNRSVQYASICVSNPNDPCTAAILILFHGLNLLIYVILIQQEKLHQQILHQQIQMNTRKLQVSKMCTLYYVFFIPLVKCIDYIHIILYSKHVNVPIILYNPYFTFMLSVYVTEHFHLKKSPSNGTYSIILLHIYFLFLDDMTTSGGASKVFSSELCIAIFFCCSHSFDLDVLLFCYLVILICSIQYYIKPLI